MTTNTLPHHSHTLSPLTNTNLLHDSITLSLCPLDAMDLFHRMEKQYGVKPNSSTYRTLVRMHILNKDINAAMKTKEEMVR